MKPASREPILVTGATGKTGRATVRQLLDAHQPVRAMVRRQDARSDELADWGADVVVADFFDTEQLVDAMRGTRRAYLCPPIHPYMVQSAVAMALAAREAKLEHVVLMSQWLSSPSHPSLMTRQTWLADQLLAMVSGLGLTIVNPGWFADNYLRVMYLAVHLGMLPMFCSDGRNAPPSNEDIARVVAAILLDPEKHAGKTYRPTGPRLLSLDEITETIGRVVGRKVRRVQMPLWMLNKATRLQNTGAYQVANLLDYIIDHNQGAFEHGAPTDHVLQVTGKPAEDFETTVRRYADLPINQRTWRNFLRVAGEFLILPLVPGYRIDHHLRHLNAPAFRQPRLAMQDATWKQSHARLNAPSSSRGQAAVLQPA